ncbi:hypothetical protein BE20_33205 [Sorangium cellulosum]|uniref:Uncharacterized protein n=1 Tax=Sorangium cellulosum TaxID=56 RepID=A0A150T2P2_SORCE|nr:hypothetical protein BE18_23970 [Sorangium cellulosum]KYF98970.1 hypothetical protein BE20_33205 [Sorangium cellulosum]
MAERRIEVELDGGNYSAAIRGLKPERRPPVAASLGLRLTFAAPARGPIALGYASHFGLGTMAPAP